MHSVVTYVRTVADLLLAFFHCSNHSTCQPCLDDSLKWCDCFHHTRQI